MVRTAAISAMAVILNKRSASLIWVSSRRSPSLFMARKTCSMRQRSRYSRTISCAAANASACPTTFNVVSRAPRASPPRSLSLWRQAIGSVFFVKKSAFMRRCRLSCAYFRRLDTFTTSLVL